MNALKYILLFIFAIILIGLIGKTVAPFDKAQTLLFFGIVAYFIGAIVYIILALVFQKHRIEAAMMGISFIFVLGILFTLMRWAFSGPLLVFGSPTLLLLSIGLFIYSLIKKRKVSLAALYAALGANCLFFCFKIMFWPGTLQLFIFASIFLIAAIILFILQKQKMTTAIVVLFILNGLISLTFFASESRMYCYKHINTIRPIYNFPEKQYQYAWLLYKDGKTEEAKINLEIAIEEAQNPDNMTIYELYDSPVITVERYKRAMDLLNANKWYEKEKSPNDKY